MARSTGKKPAMPTIADPQAIVTGDERVELEKLVGKTTLEETARICASNPPQKERKTPPKYAVENKKVSMTKGSRDGEARYCRETFGALENARRLLTAHLILRAGAGETPRQISSAIRSAGLPVLEKSVEHTIGNWKILRGRTATVFQRVELAGSNEKATDNPMLDALFERPELGDALHKLLVQRTSAPDPRRSRSGTDKTTNKTGEETDESANRSTWTEKARQPRTLKELASDIRRNHPRQRNVPSFLELIADVDDVDFETIADKAHGAGVEDDAIKKTITRARQEIVKAGLPITLVVSASRVLKKQV